MSAYYGLDMLPTRAAILCGSTAVGEDGMPVTFSVQLRDESVSPEAFAVETASGEVVTPVCATLRPADEPRERRTVLLAGPFGTPDAQPVAVEVVGDLLDDLGASLRGLRTETITPLEEGPRVVLAERYPTDTPGLQGECAEGTEQVIQLVWEGGVTGPAGASLGSEQRMGISIAVEGGAPVTPIALGDDDPDNFVLACLDTAAAPLSVTVAAGLFHDPGDDANPETSVEIVLGAF